MSEQEQAAAIDLRWVVRIIVEYAGHHRLGIADLAALISDVHKTLASLAAPPAAEPTPLTPAVPIRRSITEEAVVCLDCGFRGRILRRHLGQMHGLTPDQYRQRWGLASTHPITAPAYSAQSATVARARGFGRKAAADGGLPAARDLDPAFVASLGRRRRYGRKPKAKAAEPPAAK
jgi:MucR family transcriptional regulator, transcriptional regulator of exopolysaccharide biosynthesis